MTKPFKNTPAANLLRERIRDPQGKKTQAEIAREAGLINSNFVSLLKSGASKIPLDRVVDLAKAIEVDPAFTDAAFAGAKHRPSRSCRRRCCFRNTGNTQ